MAERFKAHAWRACIPLGIVGSNPTLSAKIYYLKKQLIKVLFYNFIINFIFEYFCNLS